MKVLYKSDTDYIVLPSKDPFVQMQQPFLIEMGYRLIEDWEPPGYTDSEDSVLSSSSASQTTDEDVQEDTEEASEPDSAQQASEEKVYVIDGKTYTESELKSKLK